MMSSPVSFDMTAALAALADGVIPADERDDGARGAGAGPRLAERVAAGVNAAVYRDGLATAEAIAGQRFGKCVAALAASEIHELLGLLCAESPVFYKQLRMDVSAIYLSDPEVWRRIGFPGPSTSTGGYADFDQRQT